MKRYVIYVIFLGSAYILGVYSGPAIYKSEEYKTRIKTVQNDTKHDKKEIVDEVIIERPDGSIETKRRTVIDTTKSTSTATKDAIKSVKKEYKERLPNNQITLMYQPKSIPDYGIMYQRRIFSSLYIGGFIMNNKVSPEFGVSVSLGF